MIHPSLSDEIKHQDDYNRLEKDVGEIPSSIEEGDKSGSLSNSDKEKLMNSRVEAENKIDLKDAVMSEELSSNNFIPDIFFEKMIKNFRTVKKEFGAKIIREVTNYDPDFLENNLKFKEFQDEVKNNVNKKVAQLKQKKLLDDDFKITQEALNILKINLMKTQEKRIKNHINSTEKKKSEYGEIVEYKVYSSNDKFKDINIRKSIKQAIKNSHDEIKINDLNVALKKSSQRKDVIFAVDSSVSMKNKINMVKRVGVSLILGSTGRDVRLGLIEFNNKVESLVSLSNNFELILDELVKIKIQNDTDIFKVLEEIELSFKNNQNKKIVVLMTDFLPTIGENQRLLNKFYSLTQKEILFYLIGIDLDNEGKKLAKEIQTINKGKLYLVDSQEKDQDVDIKIFEEFL
ncbi:MAG: VWA domain-containing protein [Candidatus Nanoarchaeia archaeon]|nr:VWA domain-containing protein [Candidatus Nanoarchaeia archaeon]